LLLDAAGINTLYPLIQGFAVLADLCKDLLAIKNGEMRRSEDEIPGFHSKTEVQLFPFLHKALILDIREADGDRLIALLENITATLEASQVHSVRNRIDHPRPDFPNQAEIEKACAAVAGIVEPMEVAGICPLLYLYSGHQVDQYGRATAILKDYRGRQIGVRKPSQYEECRLPSLRSPQLAVPAMHIGESAEFLRFRLEHTSDYTEMWRGYPRRRMRLPSEELVDGLDSSVGAPEDRVLQ